ncbi:MFS transporter [Chloroflexota bacterium]
MSEQLSGRKRPLIFYGWIIVAISFITLTMGYATRYSFSVFYVAILEEFGWLRAETAFAFSVNMITYAALSPISGTLVDRFGPRKIFPFGAILCGLGILGLSQLDSIWQLYLFSGLTASGLIFMGYIAHSCFLPHWFSLKLGTAIGIATVGMTVGNVFTIPIQYLIENIGWRGTYMVMAATVVAVIVPITSLFQRHRAEDMGLQRDGISRTEEELEAGTIKPNQKEMEDLRIVDKAWAATDWTLARAIKTGKFWLLFAQSFFIAINGNIILVHIVAFIVGAGYSNMFAASMYALSGALGLVSAVGGAISDRIGREWTFTIGATSILIGMLVLFLIRDTNSPGLPYLFAVFYGFGIGIDRPIIMASKADVFQGKHLGAIMGVNNLAYGLGAAFGAWLAGYIYDISGSYILAFSIGVICLLLSIAALWIAAPRKVRIAGGKVKREQPAS